MIKSFSFNNSISYRTDDLSEGDSVAIAQEVALYKRLRETLADAHAVVLNAQFEATGRLLYDAESVRLDDHQRFALRGVVVRLTEDGNG